MSFSHSLTLFLVVAVTACYSAGMFHTIWVREDKRLCANQPLSCVESNEFVGLTCNAPGGQIDTFQKGMCNCYSGYAPSTDDGIDCNVRAKCAPLGPDEFDSAHNNAPKRPQTWFAHDYLEILQQVPIVANRKAAWIQFVIPYGLPGNGTTGLRTCGYPGPLWNKTINQRDCIDEFRASVPWSQHIPCGFAQDPKRSVNGTTVISSTLVTTVVETFTTGSDVFERLSTSSYLISVSFASQKTFQSGTFSVSIPDATAVGVLSKYIVSNSLYDPLSGATLVDFVTTAVWPYKLATDSDSVNAAFVGVVPSIPGLLVSLSPSTDLMLSCENVARTTCTQKWRATIESAGACIDNIQGTYSFKEPLLCRDNTTNGMAGGCPSGTSAVSLSINIRNTQLCTITPVDTSNANSFVLSPYSDATHTLSSTQFQTGDKIYWTFQIVNPLVSIKSVSFNSIQLTLQSGATDILYSSDNGGSTTIGNAVNLQLQGISGFIAAGSTGTLSFSYDLFRGQLPNTLGSLHSENLEIQVATSVVVDIQYYGNTKRSIAMELSNMDTTSAGHDTKAIRVVAAGMWSLLTCALVNVLVAHLFADLMTQNSEQQEQKISSAPILTIGTALLSISLLFVLSLL